MLDNFRETAITWDKANRKVYEPLRVSAGDNKGRKLSIQVVNGGVVENLSGASLSLFWETRDKMHKGLDVFTAVDATKGEFEIYYTTGMLSNEGVLKANLVLVDTSGRVVSEPFTITVFKGIDDDAIQSSDSFTALTEALIDVSNLEQNYAPRLNDLTAQLQQSVGKEDLKIIYPKDFDVMGDGLTDDTNALRNLFEYLGTYGGRVLFSEKYAITNKIPLNFQNDVTVYLEGTSDSQFILKKNAGALYYDAIYAHSNTGVGTLYYDGLNVDGAGLGTGYGQQNRTQALSAIQIKRFFATNNKIDNIYGTGILTTHVKEAVAINDNVILDAWGYNPAVDSYGDGIYVGEAIQNPEILRNTIVRTMDEESEEVGRCGIVLEFNVKGALVQQNIIHGYNRGIHSEQTLSAHKIQHNTITGCPVCLLFTGEKGSQETLVESNFLSTRGFIHKGKELSFYGAIVQVGPPEEGSAPKYRFRNNEVVQVMTNAEVPMLLSVNAGNVVLEANNKFDADLSSSAANRQIYLGDQKNIRIDRNIFRNISNFNITYDDELEVTDNEIQAEAILTDYSTMVFERNLIRPTLGFVSKVLGKRPKGRFNDNTIWDFAKGSVNNDLVWDNDTTCEVSGNEFVRTKTEGATTPFSSTSDSKADSLFTMRKNRIRDNVLGTVRSHAFIGGWREAEGKKVSYDATKPTYGVWAAGDERINTAPVAGSYAGWKCVTPGNPGIWKGFGTLEV